MSKYILNYEFYPTGDEWEETDMEWKEFDSLDVAIEYAHELLDNEGVNFAGVDVEDENGEIIYTLFADGLEEKSGVAIHGEKVNSDTIINGLPLKWYANIHGTFMYRGQKFVMLEMTEFVSTADGEIVSFSGKAVKIGDKINATETPFINLYRLEWNGSDDTPRSVCDCGFIDL